MTNIIPVMLGADLNCYNLARAFHEAYGVKSWCFGRYKMAPTMYSSILHYTALPDLEEDETVIQVLQDFEKAHPDGELYLMACTDRYADMLIRLHDRFPRYHCPMPPKSIYQEIQKKAEFYQECDRFDIPYPKTVVKTGPVELAQVQADALGFDYPIIIKPSFSSEYFMHEFEGMRKVYVSHSPEESVQIVKTIYSHGYSDKMILQKMVAGGDSNMRVLTCFSDNKGKVRAMCLGHTMVEEHTPTGLGNHAAIVTEDVTKFPVAEKIRKMLETIGYTGFSNFDIKEDGNTGNFYVFEINLRQGRSNYYMTGAGLNLAKLIVEKYEDPGEDLQVCTQETYWHLIPSAVAFKYTEDKDLVEKARHLEKIGRSSSSLEYRYDEMHNPLRFLIVKEQLRRQFGKFAKYYPKPENAQ